MQAQERGHRPLMSIKKREFSKPGTDRGAHEARSGDLVRSHTLYAQAQQLARLGHYEWDEHVRRLVACSEAYAAIYEMTVDQMLSAAATFEDDLQLVHPGDREAYARTVLQATESGGVLSAEYRIITRSGAVRHVRELMENEPTERGTYFGTLMDITEQKRAEEALKDSISVLNAIIEGTPDYIFVKDLQGRYTTINSAAARKLGRPVDEIIGKTCFDLFSPEMAAETHREDQQVLDAGRPCIFEHESDLDDQYLWTTKYVYHDNDGNPLGIIGISRDITERRRAEEQIRHLAYHDELTNLPSVRLAKDRLSGAIARARREGSSAAVLYLDLDDFKEVNDALGHKAGDHVLIAVAERLTGCVRSTDTVARIGGDEFIVVLTGEHVAPDAVAGKVIDRLTRPISVAGGDISVSCSIGIASFPAHGATPDRLIEVADQAMYRVKREGKNNFSFADG